MANGNYQIENKWYAALPLEAEGKTGMGGFTNKIEKWLGKDVATFYESETPVTDGFSLLVKSTLVHLVARIAQLFLTAVWGLFFLGFGVWSGVAGIFTADLDQVKGGGALMLAALYLLTVGLAVDGVLAVTSPLEGIYEATRVFFSRGASTGDVDDNQSDQFGQYGQYS